jgi:hypothetical protein
MLLDCCGLVAINHLTLFHRNPALHVLV